ncbi:facilitated trehalose transporter Tret1-like, partial [Tropilaelaps mercedesae]
MTAGDKSKALLGSSSSSCYLINTQVSKVSIEDEENFAPSPGCEGREDCTRLRLMYPAVGAVFLGALAIGTVVGYPAIAISSMLAEAFSGGTVGIAMQDLSHVAWFNSIMALAALVGAFIAAEGLPLLLGGRTLTGLSTGMICVAGPVYIVEVASHETRGLLGGLFGGIISAGTLLCGVFGGLILEWRSLAVMNAALPAITALILFFMPQSPKLLISKGRIDEAIRAIKQLHGYVNARFEVLAMKGQSEHHDDPSMRDLFSKSGMKAGGIAVFLMLFQQFSGINAVMVYAVPILQASAPSVNPIYCTIMLQAIQVIFNMIASSITNRFGRRLPLIFSALGMCVSFGGFAFYQYSNRNDLVWAPVVCCGAAVIAFAIGFGPLPWLIVAEIAPTKISGIISALATSTNWTSFF